jgi:hypothetical protein
MTDNKKDQSKEKTGFSSALFIDPMKYEPHLHVQEMQEGMEGMNLGFDSYMNKRKTSIERDPKLNEFNFLGQDLLKSIDENSPIKPCRTFKFGSDRKTSEMNLIGGISDKADEIEEEGHGENSKYNQNRSGNNEHSLFYQRKTTAGESPNNTPFTSQRKKLQQLQTQEEVAEEDLPDNMQPQEMGKQLTHKPLNIYAPNFYPHNNNENVFNKVNDEDNMNMNMNEKRKKEHSKNESFDYDDPNIEENYLMRGRKSLKKQSTFTSESSPNRGHHHSNSLSATPLNIRLNPLYNDDVGFIPKNFKADHRTSLPNRGIDFNLQQSDYFVDNVNQIPENFNMGNLGNDNLQFFGNQMGNNMNMGNSLYNNFQQQQQQQLKNKTKSAFEQQQDANRMQMYGKCGWICSLCKNFNYESKFF